MSAARSLTLLLGTGPSEGATVAALRLADEAAARGHRVAVFAYGAATAVSATGTVTAGAVEALVRRGVHGGLVSWVADADVVAARAATQVPGAVHGDRSDLWRLVREADVVLGVSS